MKRNDKRNFKKRGIREDAKPKEKCMKKKYKMIQQRGNEQVEVKRQNAIRTRGVS